MESQNMISLSNGNQLTTSGPRSCRDSFSNVRFLRTVTVALFILLIGLTIAFIVTRGKNDSRHLKPNASNTLCLQGAEMCDPNTSPSNDLATSGYSTYGSHHHAHLRLYRKHIVHSGHYGHHGLAYYKRYHGFKITHGRFAYKGLGYKLTCGKTRFYRLWRSCYGRYHSRGRCFGRFRKQHLFAVYKGYSHGGPSHYYKGHGHGHGHGHGYSHGHGHVYIHGHGHGHGHGYSHGHSHVYIHGHGHGHGHGYSHGHSHIYIHGHGHGHGHGHIHRAAYYSYYKKYHGFKIHHHRFSYGGKAYKLACHRNRFYSLWNNCYTHYHSRSYCFGHLRKQHLFVSYHGGAYGHIHHSHHHGYTHDWLYRHNLFHHKKIANHHVNRIHHAANSHVSKIAYLSNKHVRNIGYQANKHVSRISNEANRHINRFRKLVKYHINRLHNHAKHHLSAVENQHKRHLIEREYQNKQHLSNEEHLHNKHEYHISKLHSEVGYGYGHGHLVSYLDYHNKYHGFPIAEHRFSYAGKAYQLKCESKRFYSLWSDCWSQYHSRSICFENLRKQHLFIDYPGDYADEYAPTKIVVKTGGDFDYKK